MIEGDIDPEVRAAVRAAEALAASTQIEGGALDGLGWAAGERIVDLHPGWSAEELLPGPVRQTLRVTRTDLLRVAATCRSSGEWSPLLVAVNAWCYGPSADGPARTRRAVRGADVDARLAGAVATLDDRGPVAAYYRLNNTGHLHGWGPALFTRFLDVVDLRDADRALGLDAVLATAVNDLVPGCDLAEADWATAEYAFFLGVLHRIAAEAGVAPSAVEAALAAKYAGSRS